MGSQAYDWPLLGFCTRIEGDVMAGLPSGVTPSSACSSSGGPRGGGCASVRLGDWRCDAADLVVGPVRGRAGGGTWGGHAAEGGEKDGAPSLRAASCVGFHCSLGRWQRDPAGSDASSGRSGWVRVRMRGAWAAERLSVRTRLLAHVYMNGDWLACLCPAVTGRRRRLAAACLACDWPAARRTHIRIGLLSFPPRRSPSVGVVCDQIWRG
ncbi:hypothetical protein L226DRAFT_380738 [Lentinus tigrinus ALCF2SS1-7]|uniref:Uncharacterized protein n=1 Tax=Lentinus tigrinus ALCF2SS1-6 TaxID=1328759 RepID=A0A5C2SL65_9APHY|nr:hypothetical protein L227DRAFT_327047 [Lentinus tigrinus ALCF2SS1-6]RPD76591.1 hypothetical protein L226DRAFT_380738 [Lentinus tigrinus ALCF2SS1-7]